MKEWAWVRTKKDNEGYGVFPPIFELLIGNQWGDKSSRVVSEHTEMMEAVRFDNYLKLLLED
jgi:hypothetical protein